MSKDVVEALTDLLAVRVSPSLKQAVERKATRCHLPAPTFVRWVLTQIANDQVVDNPIAGVIEAVREREGKQ